ncbi:MAG: hypothetical protein LLG01_17385 [Planctomycetaceae bacterium]|nr:hypothetical protein [Planctomycetaceae bacterium]
MDYTTQHYERVAQWLDGQTLELTAQEQALADEIRSGEGVLCALEASVPATAMARAQRRLVAAAAKPSRIRLALKYVVGVEAAAIAGAAMILVTLGVLSQDTPAPAIVPTEVLISAAQKPVSPGIQALAERMDQLESEIVSTPAARSSATGDGDFDTMERDLKGLLRDIKPSQGPESGT